MSKLQEDKELVKLEKKLRSEPGGQDFIEELRKQALPELEFKLKELAKHRQAILTTRKNDEELEKAKNHVSVLNAPYKEQLNGNDTKSRFIGLLIQEFEGYETEYFTQE